MLYASDSPLSEAVDRPTVTDIRVRLSSCGQYLWTCSVRWATGPTLAVVLFQPDNAQYHPSDPVIVQVRSIAQHNGFGAAKLLFGIPLHSLYPGDAIAMARHAAAGGKKENRALQTNLRFIAREVQAADAVLLGWGTRARKCAPWFEQVMRTVQANRRLDGAIYCIDKTTLGCPKNPLAKGIRAVLPTAPLKAWQ